MKKNFGNSFYDDKMKYTIKQTAKFTGISEKTLRYYDKIKLVSPYQRNEENGYRFYTIKQFYELENLKLAKSLGFPVKQYQAIQIRENDMEKGGLEKQAAALKGQISRLQAEQAALAEKIRILMTLSQNIENTESFLSSREPYFSEREEVCILISPMAESGNFEETSRQTRLLCKDARYAASLTPFWGVLLDSGKLMEGNYRIAYQFCRLKHRIDDENTMIIPGGKFFTLLGRAWTPEVLPMLEAFLGSHPSPDRYIVAEELGIFANVDSIQHQIFIRASIS